MHVKHKNVILLFSTLFIVIMKLYLNNHTLEAVQTVALIAVLYLSLCIIAKDRLPIKEGIYLAVYSLLLTLSVVLGNKIDLTSRSFIDISIRDFLAFFICWIVIFVLTAGLLQLINRYDLNSYIFHVEDKKDKGLLLKYMMLIGCTYFIFLLIYYPGIVAGDSLSSIRQIVEGFLENHHPVFYTLIIGFFFRIGKFLVDENFGIFLYCCFQIIICSFTYAYFLKWLHEKEVNSLCRNIILLYFIVSPVFSIYSITLWKDPMFCCAMLFIIMKLFDLCTGAVKRTAVKFLIIACAGIVMSLLRNNGMYILIFVFLGMLIFLRDKKTLYFMLPSIFLVYLITGPFYNNVLDAHPRFVEKVGIPLQQMARVVVKDGEINEKEAEFLFSLMPKESYEECYDPFIVDPIKWSQSFNNQYLNEHQSEFFDTWLSLMDDNFDIYVEQYLMGTVGFWRIGEERNNEFVKLSILDNSYDIYADSVFGERMGDWIKAGLETKYARIPMGIYIWIVIFDVFYCMMKKKWIYILPLLPIIGNWGTLLVASPTAFGLRYIWINVIAFPLLVLYPFLIQHQKKEAVGANI